MNLIASQLKHRVIRKAFERVSEAGTDEMTVMVKARDTSVDAQALKTDLERRMKEVLGVRATVEVHGSGALDSYTGTSKTSKVKRLADQRR